MWWEKCDYMCLYRYLHCFIQQWTIFWGPFQNFWAGSLYVYINMCLNHELHASRMMRNILEMNPSLGKHMMPFLTNHVLFWPSNFGPNRRNHSIQELRNSIQVVSASNQRFDDHIQQEAAPNSSMKRSCAMKVTKGCVKITGVWIWFNEV